LTISGPFLGGDVEYLFAKNRWSVRANFGLIGAGAGVSYHLKPRINSSFVSLQYSRFGGDDKFNLLGVMYVYRYKKWIQAGIGLGTLLSDNGEGKRGDVMPMLNAGIYVPVSPQAVSKLKSIALPEDDNAEKKRFRQAVYGEFGGRGIWYSLNYDCWYAVGRGGLGASVGGGGVFMFGVSVMWLPVSAYYLVGSGRHHLELGAGVTPLLDVASNSVDAELSALPGTATIGYRYQPARGVLFRAGFTPMYTTNIFVPRGGVSVGYAF
jgi:hypothetical protein